MEFNEIFDNIKKLKIQGAENIARNSARAIKTILIKTKTKNIKHLMMELNKAQKKLISIRPTEPCLRNTLNYIFSTNNEKDIVEFKSNMILRIKEVFDYFDSSKKEIVKIGTKKIKNNSIIFTHCHSATVIDVLTEAKKQGKNFEVHNTETRPLFQGRLTAKELIKNKINVVHYVDAAARFALKKADVVLFGCDAITSEAKIINKIGSELFAEIASHYQIPLYICTNSWKFDPKTLFGYEEEIEERTAKEVWPNAPKNITICNYAFECINPDLVTGVISELGVYKTHVLIEEIKKKYKWMF